MIFWFSMLVLCITQFAAGCATFRPTPYQPSINGGYGYRDERIGIGDYRITVSGNDATSAQLLRDQLLYRAAEIALKTGHDYFIVAPNAAGGLVYIKPAFLMPQFGLGSSAGFGIRVPLVQYEGYQVGVEPSRRLIATATILISNQKRVGAKNVFDAEEARDRLKPIIASPVP